jgi:hypothetical protein
MQLPAVQILSSNFIRSPAVQITSSGASFACRNEREEEEPERERERERERESWTAGSPNPKMQSPAVQILSSGFIRPPTVQITSSGASFTGRKERRRRSRERESVGRLALQIPRCSHRPFRSRRPELHSPAGKREEEEPHRERERESWLKKKKKRKKERKKRKEKRKI